MVLEHLYYAILEFVPQSVVHRHAKIPDFDRLRETGAKNVLEKL